MASSLVVDNDQIQSKNGSGQSSDDRTKNSGNIPVSASNFGSPYIGIYPFETQQSVERRAAAAAARRKRRSALIRRSKFPKALALRSTGQSATNLIAIEVPSSDFKSNENDFIQLTPSTVEGVKQIAHRLYNKGEIVAIPTECTYEMLVKVPMQKYDDKGFITDVPSTETIRELLKHNEGAGFSTLNTADIYDLNQIDAENKQSHICNALESPSSILELSLENTNRFRPFFAPHLYLSSVAALEKCEFLKQQLPKKSYAIKICSNQGRRGSTESSGSGSGNSNNGSAAKAVLATFSESMVVLHRMAKHLWPGPVKLYVALPEPSAITITSRRCPGHYIGLRCPSHPLALKVLMEYEGIDKGNLAMDARGSGLFPSSPLTKNSNVPVAKEESQSLLFGASMIRSHCAIKDSGQQDSILFTTSAKDVALHHKPLPIGSCKMLSSVLNGEEVLEIFSVPTCEYGEPCPVSVWIDATSRVITVQGLGQSFFDRGTDHQHKKMKYSSSSSSHVVIAHIDDDGVERDNSNIDRLRSSFSPSSSVSTLLSNMTSESLLHALHGFKPKSMKERVIKSVLMRWKVNVLPDYDNP